MSAPLRIDPAALRIGRQHVVSAELWNGICDCPKYPKTHAAHLSGGSVYSTGKTDD